MIRVNQTYFSFNNRCKSVLLSQSLPAVVNFSFAESTDIINTTQLTDSNLNIKTNLTNINTFAENLGSSNTLIF